MYLSHIMKHTSWQVKIIVCLFFVATSFQGFSQKMFQKIMGGSSEDYLRSVESLPDGGYITAGYSSSRGVGSSDAIIVKLASDGTHIWNKFYGGNFDDKAFSIVITPDRGYVVAGYTTSYGGGDKDVYLFKTDSIGNLLWTKTFGGNKLDEANSMQLCSDGGFILAGTTFSYGSGLYDMYLLKTDSAGNLQWSRTYGGTAMEEGYWVTQTDDGGYAITGRTASYGTGSGNYDVYIVKTDAAGNLVWSRTVGGSGNFEQGKCIQQTADRGYIITGGSDSFGIGDPDLYMIKLDVLGNVQWTKTYGQSGSNIYETGIYVKQTSDKGFIATGCKTNANHSAYFFKTDSVGNLNWLRAYGGADHEYFFDLEETSDNGYFLIGATHSWASGAYTVGGDDIYILKSDSIGNSGCNEITPTMITRSGGNTSAGALVDSGAAVSSGGVINTFCFDTLTLCTNTPSFHIAKTVLNLGNDTVLCPGETLILNAQNAGAAYLWQNGATTQTLTINTSGTYYVSVNYPCIAAYDTIVVSVGTLTASVAGNNFVCKGSTAILSASGGATYSWSTGETSSAIMVNPTSTTLYNVIVSNGGSCADTATLTVNVSDLPMAFAGNDTTIAGGTSIILNASGGTSYRWLPAPGISCTTCSSVLLTPQQTATYCVEVSDVSGSCMDTACVTITVEGCGSIFLPNVFSPNGDGQNDYFKVYGANCIEQFYLTIYNRWGEIVFITDDANNQWDGTHRGAEENTGVFMYILNVKFSNDEMLEKSGSINLIR